MAVSEVYRQPLCSCHLSDDPRLDFRPQVELGARHSDQIATSTGITRDFVATSQVAVLDVEGHEAVVALTVKALVSLDLSLEHLAGVDEHVSAPLVVSGSP